MLVALAPPLLLVSFAAACVVPFMFSLPSHWLLAVVNLVVTILIASQTDASSCHDDKRHKRNAVNCSVVRCVALHTRAYLLTGISGAGK